MASTGQRYAVGIGTGAATGAATGSAFGPWGTLIGGALGAGVGAIGAATGSAFGPWGTLIGGALGAGVGAIGAATAGSDEDKARALTDEEQKRRRKLLLVQYLRNEAAKYGAPTDFLDASLAKEGLDHQDLQENRAWNNQSRLSPNSFVPMAQGLAQAAGKIYGQAAPPTLQLGPMVTADTYARGAEPGAAIGGPMTAGPIAAGEGGVSTLFDELNRRRVGY